MAVLRTIVWFFYFFGYLVVHLGALNKGLRAKAAGDTATVRSLLNEHIPHWCGTLIKMAGITVTVEGKENIPTEGACVFVGNHRSYYDIAFALTCLDEPHGLVAKQEVGRIPLVRKWMELLDCVYVQREDPRASLRALNRATELVKEGNSMTIFPEGTRFKGAEGDIGEFKGGAIRMALKARAPIVPFAISHSRDCMENHHMLMTPTHVLFRILPPVDVTTLSKEEQKALPAVLQAEIQKNIVV